MGGAAYGEAMRQTRALFEGGAVGGLTDRELLARYVARSDGAAFEAIVIRHGPMVLRACSAAVGDEHAAHDAFQATFLVLVRKAKSIRVGDSLGPWLHEVARRVSACARSASARRARHERRAAERSPRTMMGTEVDDLAPVLHEEVGRLPDHYRTAVVLCDLEGLTQEQAASRLGWPLGTVRSRLARGRDRLRGRLTRRGLTPAAFPFALPALPDATVEAAARLGSGGEVPPSVRLLTSKGLRAMTLIRWKTAAALAMAFGLVAAGAVALARQSPDATPKARATGKGHPDVPPTASSPAGEKDFAGETQPIVRVAPSRTKIWAFSPATHAWRTYRLPQGVEVAPAEGFGGNAGGVGGDAGAMRMEPMIDTHGEAIAPALVGKEIDEIAVFHVPGGVWVRQALKEPARGKCQLYAGPRSAIGRVGRYLYGFSAATGRWEVRDIGEDADKDKHVRPPEDTGFPPKYPGHFPGGLLPIQTNDRMQVIRTGHYICGFSVPTGTWDVLDLGADNDNSYPLGGMPFSNASVLVPRGDHLFIFNAARGRFQDVESEEGR